MFVGLKGAGFRRLLDDKPEALFLVPGVSAGMERINVVREADLKAGDWTEGIIRKKAFDVRGLSVAQTQVPGGVASGWHHHGERHLYGFLVVGRLQLEYGTDGQLVADVSRGDFFYIPPRLVHRDVNPSRQEPAVIVNIAAGEGPTLVNVDGPDRS